MTLSTEIVTEVEQLAALAVEWDELFARTQRREPFLTADWHLAWHAHLAEGLDPRYILARRNGCLAGLMPLVERMERRRGQIIRVRCFPIGQSSGNLRMDILADAPDDVARALVGALVAEAESWDRLELDGLVVGSEPARALQRAIEAAGLRGAGFSLAGDFTAIPECRSWESFARSRGRNFQKNVNRAARRLASSPELRIEHFARPAEVRATLQRVVALDARCTKAVKDGFVALDGRVAEFYRDLIDRFSAREACRIDVVARGPDAVASLITLHAGDAIFFLHSAFVENVAEIGTGWLLLSARIQQAWSDGQQFVDLNGRTTFVRSFSEHAQGYATAVIHSPSLRGRLARWRDEELSPVIAAARGTRRRFTLIPTVDSGAAPAERHAFVAQLAGSGRVAFYADGRSALRAGLGALPLAAGDEILFPSYHCGSEFEVLLAARLDLRFYQVPRSLVIDLAEIARRATSRTRAVYVIHYLGWLQDLAPIRSFCDERGLLLIEDAAQALYLREARGDLSIFSPHKFLPIADGGILRLAGSGLVEPPAPLSAVERFALAVRSLAARAEATSGPGALLTGSASLGLRLAADRLPRPKDNRPRAMSRQSRAILASSPHGEIARRRRRNFERLRDGLAAHGMRPLREDLPASAVPLLFPLIAENAAPLLMRLRDAGIEAGLHWSGLDSHFRVDEHPSALYLKTHLCVLPVHQGLGDEDIGRMLSVLNSNS